VRRELERILATTPTLERMLAEAFEAGAMYGRTGVTREWSDQDLASAARSDARIRARDSDLALTVRFSSNKTGSGG
jgi:hypothetical protein